MSLRWVPLESNPEVMTRYNESLGSRKGRWVDVFGLDEELLGMVPQPVMAVMLLFPISQDYDSYCGKIDSEINQSKSTPEDLFYMKQFIHNACGTIGVIHALANNQDEVAIADGSPLASFLNKTKSLNPVERGEALQNETDIGTAHEQLSAEGQTSAPNREDSLVTHFVTLVEKGGFLFELDGRRNAPVNHGPSSKNTLLQDAAKICKARMEQRPGDYRFTIMALTAGFEQ